MERLRRRSDPLHLHGLGLASDGHMGLSINSFKGIPRSRNGKCPCTPLTGSAAFAWPRLVSAPSPAGVSPLCWDAGGWVPCTLPSEPLQHPSPPPCSPVPVLTLRFFPTSWCSKG